MNDSKFSVRLLWQCALLVMGLQLAGCGGGGTSTAAATQPGSNSDGPTQAQPPMALAASVQVGLEVPAALNAEPFNTPRQLTVPPGFGVRLWARVNKARFMALAPNGDVLVSQPESGKIFLLRERADDIPQSFEFASGLQKPHDMVFHAIGSTVYLYIAESNRITRSIYTSGETSSGSREIVVDNLPDASNNELQGAYFHELKNIAISPDNKLYVSIASSCNVCVEDTQLDPQRGAIYEYNADGSGQRLFARGLRNAEGLDFIPGTSTLWVAVNNRDEIPYPFQDDFDGDGSNDYSKILPRFIDDNPPEPFTMVRDGGHYGWPFCNSIANPAMSLLELVPDQDLNENQQELDCASIDRSSKGIQAHSAPLGLSFLHDTSVPAPYRNGAAIALHGCWNCTSLRAGYKLVYFPFDSAGNAGNEISLMEGFVIDPDARTLWGRPVDVIADAKGNLLISDDYAGAIYQLYANGS